MFGFVVGEFWTHTARESVPPAGDAVLLLETTVLKLNVVPLSAICALLEDPPRLSRMSDAARAMAHPEAARDIAELAARVAGIQNPATD